MKDALTKLAESLAHGAVNVYDPAEAMEKLAELSSLFYDLGASCLGNPNAREWLNHMSDKIDNEVAKMEEEVDELFDDSGECEYCGKAWDYDHECPGTLSEARECEKIERDYR